MPWPPSTNSPTGRRRRCCCSCAPAPPNGSRRSPPNWAPAARPCRVRAAQFTSAIARDGLDAVVRASEVLGKHLYAMPVLESPEIVYRETRDIELGSIAEILGEYRSHVLAARIGATDMCGMFGIRRDRDLTIYDVRVAADAIASIINYLGRAGDASRIILRAGVELLRRPRAAVPAHAAADPVRRPRRGAVPAAPGEPRHRRPAPRDRTRPGQRHAR